MHHNFWLKNQTVSWNGSDTKDRFHLNCKDPQKLKLLKDLGWYSSNGGISYTFNSFGFRDEEFDQRPCGIALGCSHTEGVGIPQSAAWPRVLTKITGTHTWNLGVGGSSIDTCFRLLDYWLPRLKPQFVTMCIPPADRVEVFDRSNPASLMNTQTDPDYLHSYFKVWASDDSNAVISKRKNMLAIQHLCDLAQVPLRYIDSAEWITEGYARDLMHHGVEANEEFAHKMHQLLLN